MHTGDTMAGSGAYFAAATQQLHGTILLAYEHHADVGRPYLTYARTQHTTCAAPDAKHSMAPGSTCCTMLAHAAAVDSRPLHPTHVLTTSQTQHPGKAVEYPTMLVDMFDYTRPGKDHRFNNLIAWVLNECRQVGTRCLNQNCRCAH
jgi:hypothetical protein